MQKRQKCRCHRAIKHAQPCSDGQSNLPVRPSCDLVQPGNLAGARSVNGQFDFVYDGSGIEYIVNTEATEYPTTAW
jgi:hypothetical protein